MTMDLMRRLPAAVLLLLILATGVGSALSDPEERPLVIATARGDRGPPAPYLHQRTGIAYLYMSYVFDSLATQDISGALVPALARSWSRSADGLSYDIEIDPAAAWHDGHPVTADDVAFTFSYMAEHPYPYVSVAGIKETQVLSSHRIKVRLLRPNAGFEAGILGTLPILPRHVFQFVSNPTRYSAPEAFIGSGPYKLRTHDPAQGRYLFERNDLYHLGIPAFRQVAIVRMNTDAAIRALKSGEIDVIADLPFDRAGELLSAGLRVTTAASNFVPRLTFNHSGLAGNRDFRQALARILDRRALAEIAYRGSAAVADTGYFQPGSPWLRGPGEPAVTRAPEAATEHLRALGWTREPDGRWAVAGRAVRLRLLTDPGLRKLATAVADQLEEFGIDVGLDVVEVATLSGIIQSGAYDLAVMHGSTMGDPNDVAGRVFGQAANADRLPPEPAMQALLTAQAVTLDPGERIDLLEQFQDLYREILPSLMLVNPLFASAHTDRVMPRFLPDGVAIGIPSSLPKAVLLTPPPGRPNGGALR